MDGFGEKSYSNLIAATDRSRSSTPARLIYALGINGIGSANARLIARHCSDDWAKIENIGFDELMQIKGIGDVMAKAFCGFFSDEENRRKVHDILDEITFEKAQEKTQDLEGMVFVITGSLNGFENRGALKSLIEERGGKVSGSVSGNTDYLINNDITSASSKNNKAKELGVQIISEEDFCEKFKIGE